MDEFDEIVREFLVESYENLDQLDRDLVALEQEPDSRDLLQSIFRTIHTIKGTSGFLAFGKLEALTHAGEGLLAKLRDGGLPLTQERATGLLELVDAVRGILASIEADGSEGTREHTRLVTRLTTLQIGPPPGSAPGSASGAKPSGAGSGTGSRRAAGLPAVKRSGGRAQGDGSTAAASQDEKPPAPTNGKADRTTKAGEKSAGRAVGQAGGKAGQETGNGAAADRGSERAQAAPAETNSDGSNDGSSTGKPAPLFGELLKEHSDIDDDDLAVARLEQELGDRRPLGEILVEHGQVTPQQVQEALAAQTEAKVAGPGAVAETSLRVDVTLLDTLMRLVGELVLTRNQVVATAASQGDPAMMRSAQRLNLLVTELQEGVMKTRMQPIDTVFSKLPRIVRDLGVACGKEVRLELDGRETELDKTILEAIKDPLMHAVRNAVDHGIETAEERAAAGKPAEGLLRLRAFHEGGQVNIEISDDGAGIDPQKLALKALQNGLLTAEQLNAMGPRDLVNLIFMPGFSTADEVTNVSGRGVGMDVVRTNIERIGGTVDVTSDKGKGTKLRIKIPLTLAIIPALTIQCAGDRYAVPQVSLEELLCLEGEQARTGVEYLSDAPVFRLRGNLLPLVWLDHVLELTQAPHVGDTVYILVLQADGRRFGLVVDRVLNTEEIVVKPLSRQLKGIGTYAGATILGDGRVALILDVRSLARRARVVSETDSRADAGRATVTEAVADGPDPLLVVSVGERRVGVPLEMVTRLEEVDQRKVERVGHSEVVQYRGHLLPLGRLCDLLDEPSSIGPDDPLKVIVYTQGERSVGLVVDAVIDIGAEAPGSRGDLVAPGVLGVAVIQDKITELLDMEQAIVAADPRFFDAVAASGAADVPAYGDTYARMGS